MAFANTNDVNKYLPADKLQAENEELGDLHIDAERLITGRLGSVVPSSTFALWTEPIETPPVIRRIAGLIAAAMFYAKMAAEDEADGSEYANNLYNMAMEEIANIISGATVIIDPDGNPVVIDATSDLRFYPNAATPEPFFAIADAWS